MIGQYKLNEIYNEDSYIAIKKIPNKSINCIYVDIPYLIVKGGSGSSSLSKRINKINTEDLSEMNKGIDYNIFKEFKRVMKKINLFIWCSKMQIHEIMNYWLSYDNINFEILTWNKTNPTPATNNVWLPNIEYCLYFKEKGIVLNDGYEYKSKWYISPLNVKNKKLYAHPTIKPIEFVKNHLLHCTNENDIIADFFLGSGTTAVAAKALNRRYIGFEINTEYYNIAKNRLNSLTQIHSNLNMKKLFND